MRRNPLTLPALALAAFGLAPSAGAQITFPTATTTTAVRTTTTTTTTTPTGPRDMTASEIAQFAPILYLHSADVYRPMNPVDFIRRSRFRHHRSWQSDQGFHRLTQQWVTTDSHASEYYDIPTNVLSAYTLHANGENRRPRDSNCGDSYNVFLETDSRQYGDLSPNGDVPVFWTYQRWSDLHKIQFWWFFGFNQTPVSVIGHQGDWEHVTVWVSGGRVQSVFFASHEGGRTLGPSSISMNGTRPIVFVAWGTHASYPTAGLQSYPLGLGLSFYDHTDHGQLWDTRLRLLPLASQPWKDYAGAWGSVGELGTTTGPLGPWHKRNGS